MNLDKIDREYARYERELARYEKAMSSVDRASVDLRALDGVGAALDKAGAFDAGLRGAHAASEAIRGAEHGARRGALDAASGAASIAKTAPDLVMDSKPNGIADACSKVDVGITKLDTTPLTNTISKDVARSVAGLITEEERKWIVPAEIPALNAFDQQLTELRRTLADLGGMQRVHTDLQAALNSTWQIPALSAISSFNSRIDGVVGSIARSGAMSVWQS